jgi:cell division GTPase FtsZ
MKLVIIGLGQCGSRIADEFARLNRRALSERHTEICPGVFAVNTDAADLSGLTTIKTDYQHRILIGGRRTGGHGVGKINELGAEIAREDADKVVDALRSTKRFYETDGFLLVASAGGGTGSGSLPIMVKHVKERYADKPVYAIAVLPFEHEEQNEERAVYNTAVCLKSVYSVADAVFLVDNQRYVRKDYSLRYNLSKINSLIVEPFYNLMCAGEEKKANKVGAKTVDAGDIIQTLQGWTVLGWGQSRLKMQINLGSTDFRSKSAETHKGIQAMDEALSELSTRCNPKDAGRALYIITAPAKEINMDLVKELTDWLKTLAPNAVIRNGDYPVGKTVEITLLISELSDVERVRDYYNRSTELVPIIKQRQEQARIKLQSIEECGKDIPTVF